MTTIIKYSILFFFSIYCSAFASDKSKELFLNYDTTDVPLDLTVPLQVKIDSSDINKKIILSWESSLESIRYKIFRNHSDSTYIGNPVFTQKDTSGTFFTDEDFTEGQIYDYGVEDYRVRYSSYGYIAAGYKIPPVHFKGKILVLIDETIYDELDSLLFIFKIDLIGDGWQPVFKSVPRTEKFNPEAVKNIKNIIINEYIKPDGLRSVLFLGRIAVPYSGQGAIDGHSDHYGAWPSDTYYADLDGIWTDTSAVDTSAADPRNHNKPGDGKFDNFRIPSDAELEFGRVDFYNMPAFEETEIELYKRYLIKNHKWRNNLIKYPDSAGIVNYFPVHELNESPSSNGWQNLSSLVGLENITEYDDRNILWDKRFLWYWGTGPGSYNSSYKCLYTDELAIQNHNAVFTVVFGSYNGDWDSEDNVLRAAIASEPSILTCAWAGRPFWQFIHMGLGKHIGYSVLKSLNNTSASYPSSAKYGSRGAHISFMGDPTLKMYNLSPVAFLEPESDSGRVYINWVGTNENEAYYIYRSNSLDSKFELLNDTPIASNSYVDNEPDFGLNYYMIRPVRLEYTKSGSFYNLGIGKITAINNYPPIPNKSINAIAYPNPSSGIINLLVYSDKQSEGEISIIENTGRKIDFSKKIYLNEGWQLINSEALSAVLSQNADGAYFILIETSDNSLTIPIILQK